MRHCLYTLLLTFLIVVANGQNYDKDWDALNQQLEAGQQVAAAQWEAFAAKYKSSMDKYPDNSAQLYSLLGSAYYKQEQIEKAGDNFLLSFKYAQQAQDTTLKYIVAYSLGVYNYNNNHLLDAESYYRYSLPGMAVIYGQTSREYTALFSEYTRLLVDMGRYDEAKPYVGALLYYYKTLDGENNVTYIGLLNSQAVIAQNLGNYNEAIAIFLDQVTNENLLKLGDTLAFIIQISNLGDVYREVGSFDLAIANLKRARNLYNSYKPGAKKKKLSDRSVLATIENNLGLCYRALGDPQQAEDAYNQAQAIYKAIGEDNTEPYFTTLSNKASLLSDLGRWGEASELLLYALDVRKKYFGENTENYANALANLANVYFDAGYYDQALEKNLEANAIYKKTVGENHQGYANNLNSLALCYLHFKNYKKAEECKLQALKIIEASVGKHHYRYSSYLISTVGLYRETRQYAKAEASLKEAMTLVEKDFGRRHELFARAQLGLAEIYAVQSRFAEAAPLYKECLEYYAAQLSDYFNAMSEENQAEFLQFITPAFESYNIYLINYKLLQPGKDFSEELQRSLKYQMLLKSLLANRSAQLRREVAASNDPQLKTLYNNWVQLKNDLVNSFKSTEPVGDNNAELKKVSDLELALKAKTNNFPKSNSVTFSELRNKLGNNEAAIEIFKVNEELNDSSSAIHYGALLVTKNSSQPGFVIFKNGNYLDGEGFERYANAIDEQLEDSASYALYFRAFEPFLKGVSRIYLSADGVFHKISFAGLYNGATKKYVSDVYEVLQTSNLAFVSAASVATVPALTAALFGYPDYDYDFKKQADTKAAEPAQLVAKRFGLTNLAKLPGTKTEVQEIAATLKGKGWQAAVYIDQQASEENLRKINSPRVLHIATHGFYLKDIQSNDRLFLGFERQAMQANALLRSGIILAGAGPATEDSTNHNAQNDGILNADEATLLNLSQTDLVVLSACQTGLGDDMGTEGVAGLQRSFAVAGARHIVMSLWPVDDAATQMLMTAFYKNYAQGQPVEAAFKQAQVAVRQAHPHPYYWAAFVLLKTFN